MRYVTVVNPYDYDVRYGYAEMLGSWAGTAEDESEATELRERTVVQLQTAVAVRPHSRRIRLLLGETVLALGREAAAEKEAVALLALYPDYPEGKRLLESARRG